MTTTAKVFDHELQQVVLPISRAPKNQSLLSIDEVLLLVEGVRRDEAQGWKAVYQKAIQDAGLFETEVADALGVDKGNFSKMITGATMQQRRIDEFCRIVGNTIITQVQAALSGLECRPLESELERQNRELREELDAQRRKHETIIAFWKEVKGV